MTPEKIGSFDFCANERLGDALEIASENQRHKLSRSERGWCVLWAISNKSSYEILRLGLREIRAGGTVDYAGGCVLGPNAGTVIGL